MRLARPTDRRGKDHDGCLWGESDHALAGVRSPRGRTVLLVEDEPTVRQTLSRLLARDGLRVLEAADVGEAARLATAVEIDLVVSDVVLPTGCGATLARQLRRADPALAVVLVTGYLAEDLAARGAPVGGWPVLAKPCRARELRAAVSRAFDEAAEAA